MQQGLKRAGLALARLYPMGLSLFWKAPAVVALAVLPELVQHVVEIRLGMFDSREAFRALSDDPTRMAFGYVKIAGLSLAMLAAARFWWCHEHGGRWYDLRAIAWARFATGFVFFMLLPATPALFAFQIGEPAAQAIAISLSLLLLPALFLMLAGFLGDRQTTARAMWRRSWPWALLIAILVVAAFFPPQWLHQMNHEWALGAPVGLVWGLMIFDSMLVGLLAGLTGTALFLGYAAFVDGERK